MSNIVSQFFQKIKQTASVESHQSVEYEWESRASTFLFVSLKVLCRKCFHSAGLYMKLI